MSGLCNADPHAVESLQTHLILISTPIVPVAVILRRVRLRPGLVFVDHRLDLVGIVPCPDNLGEANMKKALPYVHL